jgi:hypothetical protein
MSKKLDISLLQNAAIKHDGKLISTKYIGRLTKYEWECEYGHRWFAVPYHIVKGSVWCSKCGGTRKLSYEEVYTIGTDNEFILQSTIEEYKNNKTKLNWLCKNGHIFKSRTNDIKTGYGCIYCAGLNKPDISKLQNHAKNKGGKLLSKKYIMCESKYEWECEKKHTWLASWHGIQRGNWCPYCKSFKSELDCRNIFETYFKAKFKKCRIIPYNNSKLELDGYNEELKIAFEYNGAQHYKYVKLYHSNKATFEYQQQKDIFRRQWCKENNILLITIPYTENSNLKEFILKELQKCRS